MIPFDGSSEWVDGQIQDVTISPFVIAKWYHVGEVLNSDGITTFIDGHEINLNQ